MISTSSSEVSYENNSAANKARQRQRVLIFCHQEGMMRPIFTLPLPKIVINSFAKAGYQYVDHLFDQKKELTPKAVDILRNFGLDISDIEEVLTPPPTFSASKLLRVEALNEVIPTFCEALDRILGGGVNLGSVLQVCGPPGSGKTQLLLQLCVNIQIPSIFGGLEGEAVFIDTESCFTVSRLREIAKGAWQHCLQLVRIHNILDELKDFNVSSILKNVYYISVTSYIHLLAAIHSVKYLVSTNTKIKLIVIDSFVFPLLGLSENLERTRLACLMINQLRELAKKYNLAVILVNDLTTRISGRNKKLFPALGDGVSHMIPQTLMLGKTGSHFSAVVSKSNTLPEEIINFSILKEGIRGVKKMNVDSPGVLS